MEGLMDEVLVACEIVTSAQLEASVSPQFCDPI